MKNQEKFVSIDGVLLAIGFILVVGVLAYNIFFMESISKENQRMSEFNCETFKMHCGDLKQYENGDR